MPTGQSNGALANGHDGHQAGSLVAAEAPVKGKGKNKKALDTGEASKMLQARISQLELDAAEEKDQEQEIDKEVKKASRELAHKMAKLSSAEQVDLLVKRCTELGSDLRRTLRDTKNNKTRGDNLQREKDVNRAELSKTIGLKEKLEKLCRELQKDNNKLKNENNLLQNGQKRTQSSWDQKYATLLMTMDGYQHEADTYTGMTAPQNINNFFRRRFKDFVDQYELRELHFHSLMRTKELELQLCMARLEHERKTVEGEVNNVRHWKAQTETALRTSGELFVALRKEMDERQSWLEKENESLAQRADVATVSFLSMTNERDEWKRRADAADRKVLKLTSIIQQMQQQGRKLLGGFSRFDVPEEPVPEPPLDAGDCEVDDSVYSDQAQAEGEELLRAVGGYDSVVNEEDVFPQDKEVSEHGRESPNKGLASRKSPTGRQQHRQQELLEPPGTVEYSDSNVLDWGLRLPFGPERPPTPAMAGPTALNGH